MMHRVMYWHFWCHFLMNIFNVSFQIITSGKGLATYWTPRYLFRSVSYWEMNLFVKFSAIISSSFSSPAYIPSLPRPPRLSHIPPPLSYSSSSIIFLLLSHIPPPPALTPPHIPLPPPLPPLYSYTHITSSSFCINNTLFAVLLFKSQNTDPRLDH